jgi:fibronectin type 3 domain-containing protein
MAIPSTPQNVNLQQGNGDTFLSWDIVSGATSYSVQRSTDGVTFSTLASPTTNYYLDESVTVGTLYYYQVASTNSSGTSSYSSPLNIVPSRSADLSLQQVRLMSQQRADRVGSDFVTMPEWNSYISQSYFELYDLLITVYEDYFVQSPYSITTDGTAQLTLPNDFYKLLGVDIGVAASTNAWVTLKKFDFISRNRFVYPQITSTALGIFNLQYRLVGNTLYFIPTPSAGQTVRIWYIPKLTQPLQDTDILTGTSGWLEYVIVDAAIKALQKEESDVTVLAMQKAALIKRIEESSMNRDAGQPDTISDTRTWSERFGGYGGGPGWDGGFGGY